jgi:biopolymer transport protein ExbB
MNTPRSYERWIPLLVVTLAAIWLAPRLVGQEAAEPQEPAATAEQDAAAEKQSDPELEAVTVEPTADETDVSPDKTVVPADPADSNGDSLLAMIYDSGATGVAFMGVLGLFSLVAATVAIERFVNMRRGQMIPRDFVDGLQQLTREPGTAPELFAELCKTTTAPIAAILQAGLLRLGRPLVEVEKAMEDAAVREMSETQAKIRPLRTVGSIAPLVGLLGTVVGMIIAFHTASQAGLGKAELLAKGIYMALLTTAGGLSVAIPSLLLGSYFGGRLEKFFREMDKHLMPAVPFLANSATLPAGEVNKSEKAREPEKTRAPEKPREAKEKEIEQPAPVKKSDNPLMSM